MSVAGRYRAWLDTDAGVRATALALTALTFALSVPKHADFGYWAESRLAWTTYLAVGAAVTYWLSATVIREFVAEVSD